MSDYMEFLKAKSQLGGNHGFEPTFLPEWLFDFQKSLVEWAVHKGRGAWLIDCGMGKGPMGLVWAQNVVEKTNGNMLVACPLAVSHQLVREGEKFGIEIHRSNDGQPKGKITVTNYERLHLFDSSDYVGMWCDESGAIKNYSGVTKNAVTEFMRSLPYRLLGSATSAPNDTIELGTHSEALGELGYMDMLAMYFKNDQNTCDSGRRYAMSGGMAPKFRFKKHAETHFWRWVCSWARAARKPSDLGFDDLDFILPPLIERQHVINKGFVRPGELFSRPAIGKKEELAEARETIQERCEKAAELASQHERSVAWCNLNPEGDLLEKLIPDCVQVAGSDPDDEKEEKILAFLSGQSRRMVTKGKIAGLGLNLQLCNHATYFPDHSYERFYQIERRFWRFGQNNPVTFDIVTTPGGQNILKNLQRKAAAADKMFTELVAHMNDAMRVDGLRGFEKKMEVAPWVLKINASQKTTASI